MYMGVSLNCSVFLNTFFSYMSFNKFNYNFVLLFLVLYTVLKIIISIATLKYLTEKEVRMYLSSMLQ